ncbi:MAG: CHASE2 domain-containing protein, partial [Prochloraceae cyanobacterium]|nr:CHASE2 domain-containing protein [Prochloraceae cyanobacterium]
MNTNILGDRFQIIKYLGEGSFGQTYLAEDLQYFHRRCVVKHLRPIVGRPERLDIIKSLFKKEALSLDKLGQFHSQIPSLIAYFEENQQLYLVEEFIEGHDLRKELIQGKKWTESEALALLEDILKPLDFLHEHNYIHRDIKPSNLMRRRKDGQIVLIDFGAIKEVIQTQVINGREETQRGTIVGTPGYMPWEQASGKPKFASDIYAVGVVIIQALTGLPPSQLEDLQTRQLLWTNLVTVTPGFKLILETMTAIDLEVRYRTASDVLVALFQLKENSSRLSQKDLTTVITRQLTVVETESTSSVASSKITTNLTPARKTIAQQSWRLALAISLGIGTLVIGMRHLGILELLELKAFDRLMVLRPDEGKDPRLLIIKVTQADMYLNEQKPEQRRGASLSESSLEKLLQKLKPYQPRVIGLDIYYDFPVRAERSELLKWFQQDDRLITVCLVKDKQSAPGTSPPPDIPSSTWGARVGFSNAMVDRDGVLRRQLLGLAPPKRSKCAISNSFSLLLVLRYLAADKIEARKTETNALQIGKITIKRVRENTVGYHQIDSRGWQMMLNYRSSKVLASEITLTEAINENKLTAELVRDRIVLIGTVDPTFKDFHLTPYSQGYYDKKSGVEIQGHMVSQLLSAVLDKRPLLWWWPKWVENIWILGWSIIGGIIVSRARSPRTLMASAAGGLIILLGFCYLLLLQGGWIPLIPPLF